jgi:hypothetical protein
MVMFQNVYSDTNRVTDTGIFSVHEQAEQLVLLTLSKQVCR